MKPNPVLSLSTETLRRLDANDLAAIFGGKAQGASGGGGGNPFDNLNPGSQANDGKPSIIPSADGCVHNQCTAVPLVPANPFLPSPIITVGNPTNQQIPSPITPGGGDKNPCQLKVNNLQ